ncbi:ceramidase domain-containing protein [Paludibaculum fermentans]|uniref:ceramidase domain-containing protein n=1 Tax=Paludibaculum fermentans TaxID=1473598 RepID=UPI003EB781C5
MTSEVGIRALARPRTCAPNKTGPAALLVLLAITLCGLLWVPPVHQDPAYHLFTDQRGWFGIPNLWNVLSNLPFLAVAAAGAWILLRGPVFLVGWERAAHWLVTLGAAAVALGSGYYHWAPDSTTLFWDRLPMTVVFMSLLAITLGERISLRVGGLLLLPLIALGVFSVLSWRLTGDLRLYGAVQFFPILALPLLLILCPARYIGQRGTWWMIALYILAKILELNDGALAAYLPGGGHPWKHLAAALALLAYFVGVAQRRLDEPVTQSA